jgi:hypothetical protein
MTGRVVTLLGLGVVLALGSVGCNSGPKVVDAAGKVTFDGGVPTGAGVKVIRFEPTPDSTAEVRKGASCNVAEDGSFEMYTRVPGDGVYAGKYAVVFSVLNSPIEQKSLIDPKYTSSATTPYIIELTDDRSDLSFTIESK